MALTHRKQAPVMVIIKWSMDPTHMLVQMTYCIQLTMLLTKMAIDPSVPSCQHNQTIWVRTVINNKVQQLMGSTTSLSFLGSNIQSTRVSANNNPYSVPIQRNSNYIPGRQGDVYTSTPPAPPLRRQPFIPSTFDGVFYPTISTPTPSELPPFASLPQDNVGFGLNAGPIRNGHYPVLSSTYQPYLAQNELMEHSPTNPFGVRNSLLGSYADSNMVVSSTPTPFYFPSGITNSSPTPYDSIGSTNYDDTVVITPPPKRYTHTFDASVPHPPPSYLPPNNPSPFLNEQDSLYVHSFNQFNPNVIPEYPINQMPYRTVTDYGPYHRYSNK